MYWTVYDVSDGAPACPNDKLFGASVNGPGVAVMFVVVVPETVAVIDGTEGGPAVKKLRPVIVVIVLIPL